MGLPERQDAMTLLREHVKQENLVRHGIATEAIMRALARRLGGDEDLWGISGLLHDLDLELVDNDMQRHARTTVGILEARGFPKEGLQAILAHNGDVLGIPLVSPFDHALTAAETVTGLVVACTLVYPSRKVADVQAASIRKRMKEKRFAANVNRDRIQEIEKVGIPLDDFIDIALEAMRGVAADIGL
jgi:putative nucleotidyltransferase with HDIG domain